MEYIISFKPLRNNQSEMLKEMFVHMDAIEKLASYFAEERLDFMELYQKVNSVAMGASGQPLSVSELKDFQDLTELKKKAMDFPYNQMYPRILYQ